MVCLSCRAEHPIIMDIARQVTIPVYGLAYKDDNQAVQQWLVQYGDPYKKVGLDTAGQVAIDWGVYGTPETFFIDAKGVIRHKHVGPLTHAIWRQEFEPLLAGMTHA